MSTASTAPLVQIISCRPGQSFTDVLQRHHPAMEYKLDLIAKDGTQGVLILWSGENAFKAMMAAGEFQDKQRSLRRRIQTERQFDIVLEPTRVAFDTSGKSVLDAKAVLIVSGRLTTGASPTEFFKEALSMDGAVVMGRSFLGVPGMISKIVLQGSQGGEANSIGGCYLFEDQQSMEDYLTSDLWAKEQAETPWEDMRLEQYGLVSNDVPSAA